MRFVNYIFLFVFSILQINFTFAQKVLPDTLVFGTDKNYPPFEYIDENGEAAGFNIDLIHAVADEMNFNVKIKLGDWPDIRKEFELAGTVHITDMFYSEKRDEILNFATAHKIQNAEIYVNTENKDIKSLSDLEQKKVIVQKSALAEEYIKTNIPSATLIQVNSEVEAIEFLSKGLGDATIISNTTPTGNITNIKSIGISILPREYCFVVTSDNDKILRIINTGLSNLKENGKFAEIEEKWFGDESNGKLLSYLIGLLIIISIVSVIIISINRTLRRLVKKKTEDLYYSLERLSLISKVKSKRIDKLTSKEQTKERIEFITKAFNVETCVIRIFEDDVLNLFTQTGIQKEDVILSETGINKFSENILESKKSFFIADSKDKINFKHYCFYAGAPLIVEKKTIGIIEFLSANKQYKFTDLDIEHFRLVADQLAILIENTSLFEQNQTQRKTLIKQNIRQKETEKELIISKEKSEESNRLKTAFLANMSHEIRTPMNGILGFTELLKKPELTEAKQRKFINIIESSGNRLLNVINDIIDLSKIESGTVPINYSNISIDSIIENIYSFFKLEANKKGLELIYNKPKQIQKISINTDENKLSGIFTNLIKNAIKYTKKGFIEIGYMIKHETLHFYVKDTGIGISKDRQHAIFERFVQADIEDREVYEGAGLGLSISKAYVKMLGGKIWVESENSGSIFYFTIPCTIECENEIINNSLKQT